VVTVPGQLPLRAANDLVPAARVDMQHALDLIRGEGVAAELLIRVAHDPAVAILKTLEAAQADFCVLGWRGATRGPNRILGSNLDRVLKEANCNFVVMQEPRGRVDRILLPTSNPQQGALAFAVGHALARTLGARNLDVLTLFPRTATEGEVDELMSELSAALAAAAGVEVRAWRHWHDPMAVEGVQVRLRPDRADSAMKELGRRSRDYDLMVLGAGPGGLLGREVLGRFTWTLAKRAACPVVAVRWRAAALHFQLQSFFDFFRDESASAVGRPDEETHDPA